MLPPGCRDHDSPVRLRETILSAVFESDTWSESKRDESITMLANSGTVTLLVSHKAFLVLISCFRYHAACKCNRPF